MEKKIENYSHLYLGCDVLKTDGQKRKLVGVYVSGALLENTETQLSDDYRMTDFKLLLRPLASMTQEEMRACGNMIYDFSDDPDLSNNWKWQEFEYGLHPEQFHWLLSKGFDLFNLIPDGLAIDVTKINSTTLK